MPTPKGYKLFFVAVPVYAAATAYVYAKDAEDAKVQAAEHAGVSLCYQCSRSIEVNEPDFQDDDATVDEMEGELGRWSSVANEDALHDELSEADDDHGSQPHIHSPAGLGQPWRCPAHPYVTNSRP